MEETINDKASKRIRLHPNSYVEFAYNNMSNSKDSKYKGDSEYKGDLESIIRSVFKEGDVIIRLMENNKSNK